MAKEKPIHNSVGGLYRRLLVEQVRPYWRRIALAVLFMLFAAAAQTFSAWLMKPVVDKVFVARNADLLWPVGLAVLTAFLVKAFSTYAQAVLMAQVGHRVITDLQIRIHDHLMGLDLAFFQSRPSGQLVSRFTQDTLLVRTAVSRVLTSLGKDTLLLVGLVTVMFVTDWLFGLLAFVVLPLALVLVVRMGRRMRKVSRATQELRGEQTALFSQAITGIRHVQADGMEGVESERMTALSERIYGLACKAARVEAASGPMIETLAGLAITAVIVFGGYRVMSGATTAGDFFAFITAALMAYEPAKRLSRLNTNLQQSMAAVERLFDVIDTPPNVVEAPDAKPLVVSGGAIRFDHVGFSYDGDLPTLTDLSVTVPAGSTVALVGPSGAGKSTLLNLIPRFYDPTAGAISIDGQDLRSVSLKSLRRSIAFVGQEVVLFDDTVRANIAYGRPDASQAEIETAARAAAAHEFIEQLPEGYDTSIGELGSRLSGGQRQRIAIARAVLKDAPILLLDEATSALDTESERAVQEALNHLKQGRTTLMIAHRLSTVRAADRILVLDQGRLVESGDHETLLRRGGLYERLHALQFRDMPAASGGMDFRDTARDGVA